MGTWKGEWHSYVFLHERPHRVEAFAKIAQELPDEEYWQLLGGVWVDTEWPSDREFTWCRLLTSERPGREGLMDDDERARHGALPDPVPVYRGYVHDDEFDGSEGMSWTLSEDRASWFAQRFAFDGDEPLVARGQVDKADVIAVFLGRQEDEVLVLPEHVDGVEIRRLEDRDRAMLAPEAAARLPSWRPTWP